MENEDPKTVIANLHNDELNAFLANGQVTERVTSIVQPPTHNFTDILITRVHNTEKTKYDQAFVTWLKTLSTKKEFGYSLLNTTTPYQRRYYGVALNVPTVFGSTSVRSHSLSQDHVEIHCLVPRYGDLLGRVEIIPNNDINVSHIVSIEIYKEVARHAPVQVLASSTGVPFVEPNDYIPMNDPKRDYKMKIVVPRWECNKWSLIETWAEQVFVCDRLRGDDEWYVQS